MLSEEEEETLNKMFEFFDMMDGWREELLMNQDMFDEGFERVWELKKKIIR